MVRTFSIGALAQPDVRLQEAPGRFQGHDPRQHGHLAASTRHLPATILKRALMRPVRAKVRGGALRVFPSWSSLHLASRA